MKLEELARTSSVAARSSVAHLDLPPLGEQRPGRSWATPALAAAGVAALVVAGFVVVGQLDGSDQGAADDVLPTPVEVPRLALADEPGWTISAAMSGDQANPRGGDRPTFDYYGAGDADDPFADGDLLIASFGVGDDGEPRSSSDGDSVEVRGVAGTVADGPEAGLPSGTTSLEWTEHDVDGNRVDIILVSRAFDGDGLVAVAEALTVDAAAATVVPGTDLGLDRLVTANGTPFDAFRASTEGSLIGYEGADATDFLVLSTGRGDLDREVVVLRWWMAEVNAVTVGGRPGYLTEPSPDLTGTGRTLIWAPADGIVANLTHFAADPTGDLAADLVPLAERAVELDDAAWEALLAEFGTGGTADVGVDEFDEIYGESSGSIDDVRYSWVLGLQGDQLCFRLADPDGSMSTCQPRRGLEPPAGSARTIDNAFGDAVAEVVIVADPVVEQVIETSGGYVVERVDADGLSWFVAVGPTTVQPRFDVIVDGDLVATLEAAVEGTAEPLPPLEELSAAVELGLTELEVLVSGVDDDLTWWLGHDGEALCLVTTAGAETAGCSVESDLTPFAPVATGAGERTFVVVRDVPSCVDAIALDVDGAASVAGVESSGRTYDVWSAPGDGVRWQFEVVVAGSTDRVDVPATGGPWPADLCAG